MIANFLRIPQLESRGLFGSWRDRDKTKVYPQSKECGFVLCIKKSLNYHFLLVSLALGLIFIPLFIPWATINIIGQYSYTPLNIIEGLIQNTTLIQPQNAFDLLNLMKSYTDSYIAFIFSIIIYIASIITMILSLVSKKPTSKVLLVTGILAMISGALWIYSIESFKFHFVQDATKSGGIIGEEFKGMEKTIINSIIVTDFGHKIVIMVGVFAILVYLWLSDKKEHNI